PRPSFVCSTISCRCGSIAARRPGVAKARAPHRGHREARRTLSEKKGSRSKYKTMETGPQTVDVEVEQQSYAKAGQLQIGEHLRLMQREYALDGFQLEQDQVFYDDVRSIAKIQLDPFELEGNRYFFFHRESALPQVVGQARAVGAFH